MAHPKSISLFGASATVGSDTKTPYRHKTDSAWAQEVATRQRIQGGAKSPHAARAGDAPPVKRIKK